MRHVYKAVDNHDEESFDDVFVFILGHQLKLVTGSHNIATCSIA